jgi:hypothetical protein
MTSTDRRTHAHPDDEMHNETVEHEESDINVRTVLMFGAAMVSIVVVCAVLIRLLFGVLERQAAADDPKVSPLAIPAGQLPPEPNLVTNERAALAKFRAEETKTLDGYGWVDQAGGVAHIPVADAKKLLVKRGLPSRSGASDRLEGTHAPAMGEASGGRTIPVAPPGADKSAAAPQGAPAPATEAPAADAGIRK